MRKLFTSSIPGAQLDRVQRSAAAGFELLKRVYALVLVILIGVAAFNLVATLIMVVMEKRKDIAVRVRWVDPSRRTLIFVVKD